MNDDYASLHLWIGGRVQGVFFRASTQAEALRLGLTGWVKNLSDGRVEAYAVGPRDNLLSLQTWCGNGPTQARVDQVDCTWGSPSLEKGFEIRR